jgi:putative tryptophan/tyrosine transport system substrate-binding protein
VIFIDFFLWHTHCGGRGKARNKKLFWLVTFLVLVAGTFVEAQRPVGKVPRIGYLSASGDPYTPEPRFEAFRQGLRDLGNIEGKNVLIEYRYAEGRLDRALSSVAEFVKLNVEVLVVGSHAAVLAAKQATKTIPIVMMTAQDPVATGIVDSLARPGEILRGSPH